MLLQKLEKKCGISIVEFLVIRFLNNITNCKWIVINCEYKIENGKMENLWMCSFKFVSNYRLKVNW